MVYIFQFLNYQISKFHPKYFNMKSFFRKLRDTIVAGLIFLLPLLIIVVIITKIFNLLTGLTGKLAALFGLKSIMGISGASIVTGVALILLCLLCGYLMRMSFVKLLNDYVDKKLARYVPGYQVYRDMARSQIEKKEEVLPYKHAAWIASGDNMLEPGFILEKLPDEKYLVFIPLAGNAKEGKLQLLPAGKVIIDPKRDIKLFQAAINNKGVGIM